LAVWMMRGNLKPRQPASFVLQDGHSGAGNGPCCDDRCASQAQLHPPQDRASWSLPGPLYDLSSTYTKTQQLTGDDGSTSAIRPLQQLIASAQYWHEASEELAAPLDCNNPFASCWLRQSKQENLPGQRRSEWKRTVGNSRPTVGWTRWSCSVPYRTRRGYLLRRLPFERPARPLVVEERTAGHGRI